MGQKMIPQEYWKLRKQELVAMAVCAIAFAVLSIVFQVAPPWWFLSFGSGAFSGWNRLDTWAIYEQQGGYAAHAAGSLVGWTIVGAASGLVFSNVCLRGKSW